MTRYSISAVGEEEVRVRRVARRWHRKRWQWQVWRVIETENKWGDETTRFAVVASGWCFTGEEAVMAGRLARSQPVDQDDDDG